MKGLCSEESGCRGLTWQAAKCQKSLSLPPSCPQWGRESRNKKVKHMDLDKHSLIGQKGKGKKIIIIKEYTKQMHNAIALAD